MSAARTVWRRRADLAVLERPGRALVVDLDEPAAGPHVLEGSAAAIWSALRAPGTVADIVGAVAAAYAVDPSRIHDECAAFLGELEERGLVIARRDDE